MSIDSEARRRNACGTRRLPWMRRFWPAPSGQVNAAARSQLAYAYRGFYAFRVTGPGPVWKIPDPGRRWHVIDPGRRWRARPA